MKCPICKKPVPDEGRDRPKTYPFCNERCKLIDLGRWLDGKYQIPVEDKAPDPDYRNGDQDGPNSLSADN
jgi:endogenous inhibitor of DNA gyrase (YacG/DUF329 family)